jgi:hypothetical protein
MLDSQWGLMRGLTVARSAVFASAVAAISVTRPRAQLSMPTGDEVERFLEQRSNCNGTRAVLFKAGLMTSTQLTFESDASGTPRSFD